MSQGSLWDAAASSSLVAGISLVSILQVGDWARVSTPAKHYFPPVTLLQISTSILCNMLYWASVHRCFLVLSNIDLCSLANVGLSGLSSPHYRANTFPMACAVLALDKLGFIVLESKA